MQQQVRMYETTKTIKGRKYRYLQWTYRGDDGRVKAGNKYLGPEDGGVRRKKQNIILAALDALTELAKNDDPLARVGLNRKERAANHAWHEAREKAEHTQQARINGLLTAPTITMDTVNEIAATQARDAAEIAEARAVNPAPGAIGNASGAASDAGSDGSTNQGSSQSPSE